MSKALDRYFYDSTFDDPWSSYSITTPQQTSRPRINRLLESTDRLLGHTTKNYQQHVSSPNPNHKQLLHRPADPHTPQTRHLHHGKPHHPYQSSLLPHFSTAPLPPPQRPGLPTHLLTRHPQPLRPLPNPAPASLPSNPPRRRGPPYVSRSAPLQRPTLPHHPSPRPRPLPAQRRVKPATQRALWQ